MITSFDGKYDFLSNFFISPVFIDGIHYMTIEHYYQASKAGNVLDHGDIARCKGPGTAKRMGRKVSMRSDWESVKTKIMYNGLIFKFTNPLLKQKLLSTGEEHITEGNYWHDNIWGNCHCVKCQTTIGDNKLGKLLMAVRTLAQIEVI